MEETTVKKMLKIINMHYNRNILKSKSRRDIMWGFLLGLLVALLLFGSANYDPQSVQQVDTEQAWNTIVNIAFNGGILIGSILLAFGLFHLVRGAMTEVKETSYGYKTGETLQKHFLHQARWYLVGGATMIVFSFVLKASL